jgi:ribosome-binding factor A
VGQQRLQRVSGEIKKEIGQIISQDVKDPRIGFVTITKVDITRDLRIAKVYFSVLGSKKQSRDTQVGLSRSCGYIRKLLSQRMNLRYTPQLQFRLDESVKHSIHISEILDKIKNQDESRGKEK